MKKVLSVLFVLQLYVTAMADGPVMGWSSWNTYRVNINDSLIYSQAKAVVEHGLDTVGYRYINIDDGFFGGRSIDGGELKFHPARFPQGLTTLVKKIHSLGLKAGIYSDAGLNTCGNFWDNDTIAENVGLYGHEVSDCKLLFDSIGFDRIKIDFCGGDSAQNNQRLSLSPKSRYSQIRNVMDSLGHKDVKLGVCRWCYPGTWVENIASDWRISGDINCSWESVKHIIYENMYLSGFSSYGHYNDMDMLEIGRGLSREEERSHFGMWCMMNSPLLIGCDLETIPDESLALLKNKNLIAINQDSLAEQAYPIKCIGGGYVLARDLSEANGRKRAVALYNPTDCPLEMSVSAAELCYASNIAVYDLFTDSVLGEMDEICTIVEPHNTYIYLTIGDERTHRSMYEAESAYLHEYQEINNPLDAGTPFLMFDKGCSGGVATANLHAITFRNVNIVKRGVYKLRFKIAQPMPSALTLICNGKSQIMSQKISDSWTMAEMTLLLEAGNNFVSLTSDGVMNVDFMLIEPIE